MSAMNTEKLDQLGCKGMESLYPEQTRISVGMATCGLATGAQAVFDEFEKILEQTDLNAVLSKTGCLGFCQREPIVDLFIPGVPRLTYVEMTPEKVVDFMDVLKPGIFPRITSSAGTVLNYCLMILLRSMISLQNRMTCPPYRSTKTFRSSPNSRRSLCETAG